MTVNAKNSQAIVIVDAGHPITDADLQKAFGDGRYQASIDKSKK